MNLERSLLFVKVFECQSDFDFEMGFQFGSCLVLVKHFEFASHFHFGKLWRFLREFALVKQFVMSSVLMLEFVFVECLVFVF